jgi:hypothetical protein
MAMIMLTEFPILCLVLYIRFPILYHHSEGDKGKKKKKKRGKEKEGERLRSKFAISFGN